MPKALVPATPKRAHGASRSPRDMGEADLAASTGSNSSDRVKHAVRQERSAPQLSERVPACLSFNKAARLPFP